MMENLFIEGLKLDLMEMMFILYGKAEKKGGRMKEKALSFS